MSWKSFAIVISLIIFGILENYYPFFNYKQNWKSRICNNLFLGLINILGSSLTIALLLNWIWQQNIWQGLFHYIRLPWLNLTLAFLFLDLYLYLWHRLMHNLPLGWFFHQIHHTELAMNISTTYRFHIVEVIASNIPRLGLIWLFGITQNQVLFYDMILAITLIFQHSNWALALKIDKSLSCLIVTPNYHRFHHSQVLSESKSNYASILTIWDKIFNSYYYSPKPENIKLGLSIKNQKLNIVDLLKLPWISKY